MITLDMMMKRKTKRLSSNIWTHDNFSVDLIVSVKTQGEKNKNEMISFG